MANAGIIKWPTGQLDLSGGCVVMGILNVTPDSFSDGGRFLDVGAAVAHGLEMARAGAAIIDIGPESSRPGSEIVSTSDQIGRAIPVIEALAAETSAVISIDSPNPEVAVAAIRAGANMINDITALADGKMAALAAESQVPVVLMHMQGTPQTMQEEPKYGDVVAEVLDFLLDRARCAEASGIDKDMIFIDPGIGFGKTGEHNLRLLKNIDKFVETGYPVLVGASRKRFIGQITGKEQPADRIFGTAATVAMCASAQVSVVRVHDVGQMLDVVKVCNAVSFG